MPELTFSVVVPVYNSVDSLTPLYNGIQAVFKARNYTFEVIFVDDHSSPATWDRLLEIKKISPENVTIIRFTKNFGQNGATLCGIDQARYNFVITIDDDLEIVPAEINKLIDRYLSDKPDIVFGLPEKAKISRMRRIGSAGIKKFFSLFEGGASIGSSFRLITPWIVSNVRTHSHDHLFINQVVSWYTNDIAVVEVQPSKRMEGKSGYSFLQLIVIAFKLIFHYTSFPLRALIFTGLLLAVTCFTIGSYYIYRKLTFGAMGGYTSLIVSIFFTTGVILVSISILGLYVKRIYDSRIRKPNYLVKVKI